MSWFARIFRRREPPAGLLRDLRVSSSSFEADPMLALYDAALLVRRSGLEHLVVNPSRAEVAALAQAGEWIAQERVALLISKLRDPAEALRPFDGGEAAYQETLEFARRAGRQ